MSEQSDSFEAWLRRQPRGVGKVRIGRETYAVAPSLTVAGRLAVSPRIVGCDTMTAFELVEAFESLSQPQRAPFAWLLRLTENRR